MLNRVLLSTVALLLAACSQTAEFHRPPAPIPQNWPTDLNILGQQDATKTHWRAFFTDPRLQALIEAALENNRDLRIAVARVKEARAQYGIVRADKLPSVNLLGSGSFLQTPSDLSGVGVPLSSERYDLNLSSVSFEVDFWGRIAGLTESARNSYLATEEAQRAVQLSLVSDVASAYFTLLQMDTLAALTRDSVALRAQTLVLVGKGRDLGGAYDFEFQQASGILDSTRAALDSIEHQRAVASNRLNFLVGSFPSDLPTGRSLDEQGLDADLAPGVPGEVLLLRPDVIAAEQRLLSAHANIGAARAAFLPKVLLTAGLGVASQGLLGLLGGGAWSFQPAISLPLFDGGRLAAGVDMAEARKVIAVAEYEKTIQLAFREVADALSARTSLSKQLKAAVSNEKSQDKRLEIAQARYNAGLISFLEVLDGQRELVASQQITAQVRRAQLESAAQLYKALGGGKSYENRTGGA